jgi:hypothetical protein
MERPIDLTFDCTDAPVMATFWKLALGYIDEPAPAPFATRGEWLASHGVPEEEWDTGAWLCDPDGIGPRLSILPVRETMVAKNRLHMDIRVSGAGADDERWRRLTSFADTLVEAGGRIMVAFPMHHTVMADPEGNEFCVGFTGIDDGRLGTGRR